MVPFSNRAETMLNRDYFERVLPDQLRGFGRPVTVMIHLSTGRAHEAYSVLAAHDTYVILEVYPEPSVAPLRAEKSRTPAAGEHPWIMDQLVLPYSSISALHVTPQAQEQSASKSIGFKSPPSGG